MVEKLVGINGYDLEVPLSDHMLVFEYSDRPGVIGNVGRILGDADINIGGMQVSRQDDRAIGVLNVDSAVPAALAAELAEVVEAKTFSVRRPAGLSHSVCRWARTAGAAGHRRDDLGAQRMSHATRPCGHARRRRRDGGGMGTPCHPLRGR